MCIRDRIKLVGIVAVIVVIAIIIVISCFNKTKKDSNKAKDTGTATENVTAVTEPVSYTHLDVYKRQVSDSCCPENCFAALKSKSMA